MSEAKVVVPSKAPMDVARSVLDACYPPEGGVYGIVYHKGWFYQWYGGQRWVARDERWMENEVYRNLDAAVLRIPIEGGYAEKALKPSLRLVRETVRAIEVLCESAFDRVPAWIGGRREKPDPARCVAFADVIVDVDKSVAEGRVVTMPRDRSFFGPGILSVEWGEGADPCPVWEACMREWSDGDERWIEARERAYGYALMADRERDKFVFEFGKPRSGKGMGTNVVLKGLLGSPAVAGVRAQDFVDKHGLEGLDASQVVVVSEASDVGRLEAQSLAGLLKSIAGQDEVRTNPKGKRMQSVTLRTLVVLQSNEVPDLPNMGGGLTSKMIPLHFGVSMVGREDPELRGKLRKELKGIAQRLVRALLRLEATGDWSLPESSEGVIRDFDRVNNVYDAFLEECFIAVEGDESAWVSNEMLRDVRESWEKQTGEKVMSRGRYVSQAHFPDKLVKGTSWRVMKRRRGEAQVYGVLGLRVKRYWAPGSGSGSKG